MSSAGSGGDAAAAGTLGGAVVGSALGAGLGAVAGSFFGAADTGAAMGAALGGVHGAAQGGAGSVAAWDARLTAAYHNCMAARGYAVEGAVVVPIHPASLGSQSSDPAVSEQTRRLHAVDALRDDGLISESEYRQKRREIIGREHGAAEGRLRELRRLFDEHFISKTEYEAKRREIIDEL